MTFDQCAKILLAQEYTLISHDGYTQPIVVIKSHKYIVRICDLFLSLDNDIYKELWSYLEYLTKLQSHTQRGLLMQTEAFTSIEKLIDIQLESSNVKKTEGEISLNGLLKNGDLATFTLTTLIIPTKEAHQCFVGRLQDWKNVTTWHVLSININSSNKGNQEKSLNTINILNILLPQNSTMGNGMILRITTSEKIGLKNLIGNFLNISEEVLTQSGQEGTYLDLSVIDESKYIIVDGFHRYFVALNNKDIFDSNLGMVPVTVIKKDINDRMASTVRHNRAQGKHSISGMSSMVFNMLDNGWEDAAICNELGMEPEELLKLKHITGFSKLFKNTEYSRSWVTKHQILIQKEFANEKQE